MRTRLAFLSGKIMDVFIRLFHLGAGSTWPGEIALRIDAFFIRRILSGSKIRTIIVVGTNGKTTTSSMITYGLVKAKKTVIHNPEGANLANGVASALIRGATLGGTLTSDFAVLEVDENAFTQVIRDIPSPSAVVFLNLFRDQLDRYGEVHAIAARWKEALSNIPSTTKLVVNGDDPQLVFLSKDKASQTTYFGAPQKDKKKIQLGHDVDSIYCPVCGKKLTYDLVSYSHLGVFHCTCGFKSPFISTNEEVSLPGFAGVYNRYNMNGALATLSVTLRKNPHAARELLDGFAPAFGRQERVNARGRDWILLLSKNPAGFNQSIQAVPELLQNKKSTVVLILNDRIPDGTDVSWIWDVEFENVSRFATDIIATGDRTYDMAIRMKYCFEKEDGERVEAIANLEEALSTAAKKQSSEVPIILLATYTGMLDARELLVGKKLL